MGIADMYEKRSSWIKHIDFMILDLVCLELAYFLSFQIRNIGMAIAKRDTGYMQIGLTTASVHVKVIVLFLILDILVVLTSQPYKDILRRGSLVELVKVFVHNTLVLGGMLLYLYITKEAQELSRAVFFITWALSVSLMYFQRIIWKKHIQNKLVSDGRMPRLLIVASRLQAGSVLKQIHDRKYNEFQIAGIALLEEDCIGDKLSGEAIVANESTMFDYCLENVVDAILLCDVSKHKLRNEYINHFLSMGQTVHVNLNTEMTELPNQMVQKIGNLTVLTTAIKTVDERLLFIKRSIDVISGLLGCLVVLVVAIPLWPIVKLQAPGPLFFSQIRVGKNGRKFRLFKFRSMYVDAEARKAELMQKNEMRGLMFKMENDPRIFPAGHFIRKYSLDELPQFFNILRGDMSLVGTRPPTVDEYEQYDQHHKVRLSIKPGLTGLWQVSGRSNIKEFNEIVRLDEEYIENWSLGLDFRIILKTFKVVLGGDGSM